MLAFLGLTSQFSYSQEKPKMAQMYSLQKKTTKGKIKHIPKNLIKGIIMDQDKISLPGANILIKGTTIGAVTNFDGEFSIEANSGEILTVSYIGFATKEVTVTQDISKTILLELEEDISGEMIVTVGGAISCTTTYQLTPEEELERKQKLEFARKNRKAFYKRKYKEHRQKIQNGEIERSKTGKFFYKLTNVFRKK